jgi:phospholipid transport system substrate-binding protein
MVQAFAILLMIAAAMVAVTVEPAGRPSEIVQASVGEVAATLALEDTTGYVLGAGRGVRADSEQARAEIRRIAGDLVDFDEMARRSLSRHWAGRTRKEQAEFVELFTNLLERTYLSRIQSCAREKIVYLEEHIEGPFATVKSKVTGRRVETGLDYRLLLKNGRWKVYDVVVDGVGLVSTYRSEFDDVIRSSSYRALVEQMREGNVAPVTTLSHASS